MALIMFTAILLGLCAFAIARIEDVSQIHMAQGKAPSQMTISWVTVASTPTEVIYGLSRDTMTLKLVGTSSSYSVASYQSGQLHEVQLIDLKPSTLYYYACGNFAEGGSISGIKSFTTLPDIGNPEQIFFGVLGDLGQTDDAKATMAHLSMNNHIDMLLHVGDLSYANCNQFLWDTYGTMVEPLASEVPWMVGAGNHEIEMLDFKGEHMFTAFEKRYRMPADQPAQFGNITYSYGYVACSPSEFQMEYNYGNSFFSFDSGTVHVINLNPYATSDTVSAQYLWLVNDLKSLDRSLTPFVVVTMHCPWYNSNTAHRDEYQTVAMRGSMEQLFYSYHVNVVFAGHVHAYERSHPVYNGQVAADGVTYITIGDGGNAEGHADGYVMPVPDWSAFRNGSQYGHGLLTNFNKTHLLWNWHRNVDGEFISMDSVFICNAAVTQC